MARPRKYNVDIPGLSCFTDARTKRVYWRYKHPITGKFHGLGTDEAEAKSIAIEANSRLVEQKMRQLFKVRDEINESRGVSISVTVWAKKYLEIQQARFDKGEIAKNTLKQRKTPVEAFVSHCGLKPINSVTVKDIVQILDVYCDKGAARMAQNVRKILIDVFKEAMHAGEVPNDFNPARATRNPSVKVQRQRLSLPEWKMIYEEAQNSPPYLCRAMLLALITAQRIGDLLTMKFSDVWDDHLHVEQQKTGNKIAIPLSLRCDAIDVSLRQAISMCRDKILSPYLIHHTHDWSSAKRGGMLAINTISERFAQCRDKINYDWAKDGTPPSFHEQRSLSERIYRSQGINTQMLLGHSSSRMTDLYNNDRGKEYKKIAI